MATPTCSQCNKSHEPEECPYRWLVTREEYDRLLKLLEVVRDFRISVTENYIA